MDQERIQFGGRFRERRTERALSLGDLARVTKIPERSLERLEAGRFDELPAEVFVRGFVRSYARALGLDAEEMVRGYGALLHQGGAVTRVENAPARPPAAKELPPPAAPDALPAPDAPRKKVTIIDTEEFRGLPAALLEAGRGSRRMPLTLAVIILVIVATLTMSLLLSRPSHTGDGLTRVETPTDRV
jgi:hypothetical protein